MALPKSWVTVTPLSKFLALILFIALPFLGFYYGLQYQSFQPSQTQNLTSGIYGKAALGPTCPGPQKVGQDCSKPFQGNFIAEIPNQDRPPIKFSSDSAGNFRASLPPGDYLIHLDSKNPFPTLKSTPAKVSSGTFTQVDLMLDTGIR